MRRLLAADWLGLLLLVVLGSAVLAAFHPAFLSGFNLYVLLVSFSLTALVAMAQMVIIAIGQMNLSVGAIGGIAAIAFAGGMEVWRLPPRPRLLLGLGLGLGCGLVNGWLVRLTGISAFVITLATLYVFKGAVIGISQAQPFYGLADSVKWLGNARARAAPRAARRAGDRPAAAGPPHGPACSGGRCWPYGGNPSRRRAVGHRRRPRGRRRARALRRPRGARRRCWSPRGSRLGQPSIGDDWLIVSFAAPILGGAALTGGYISVAATALGVLVVA